MPSLHTTRGKQTIEMEVFNVCPFGGLLCFIDLLYSYALGLDSDLFVYEVGETEDSDDTR